MVARRFYLPAIAPFLLMSAATLGCYLATGASAGLFLGSLAFITFVVPPIVAREREISGQVAALLGAIAGAAVVWWIAAGDPFITSGQIFRCLLILSAFALALWGLTGLLTRLGIAPTAAAMLIIVVAALWLTWPIWLSPWLTKIEKGSAARTGHDRAIAWLTPVHPALTMDSVVATAGGPWTERPLMYKQLTVLNQDVPYEPPQSILWALLLHTMVGAIGVMSAIAVDGLRSIWPDSHRVRGIEAST